MRRLEWSWIAWGLIACLVWCAESGTVLAQTPAPTPAPTQEPTPPPAPPSAPEPESPPIDFDDYNFSLFTQDMLLHRGKNVAKIWNDNKSNEVTQSAMLKRILFRYKILKDFDVGGSIQMSLRDEATLVDGVATDIYHPFKAASLVTGYMLYSITMSRVRIENWVNVRINFALTSRIVEKTTIQGDLELILAFNGDALVTFGIDVSANMDDGLFSATQYGVGWRF
jgi:hypothetical protein